MTDDNRDPVTPDSGTPKFGSDQGQPKDQPLFGKEDLDKILNQNRNAQDHIRTLESETATMRAELLRLQEEVARSRSIDDLLDHMRQPESNTTGQTAPQFDQEQLLKTLKAEVFKDLNQAQQSSLEMENWNRSVTALRERHGDGYASYVDERARELGLSVDKMEELAKTSPNAFIELVSPGRSRSAAPTQSSQSAPLGMDTSAESMFSKIHALRFRNTPEGREAKRTWEDPDFQKRYRAFILDKARKAGSSYGNDI